VAASMLVYPLSKKERVATCDGRRVPRHTLAEGILAYLNQNWGGEERRETGIVICTSLEEPADFISQVLFIYVACFFTGCLNKRCTSGLSMLVSFLPGETCQIFTALSRYNLEEVL